MKRFLIADDSAFMRLLIKNILIKNGHEIVGEAEDGRVALEKCVELMPDVVTLDITMNNMTGLEALREIVKIDKNINVIMVSAMGQDSFINEALALGAKGFLKKPFKEEAVMAAISKL